MNALSAIRDLVSSPSADITVRQLILGLVLSAATSALAAWLYRLFYDDRATGSQAHRSFLLLGPSITALFLAIQFSLPLSLGLVGALTIIRFRTPIKEPEEVGFIMLVIATSIICATFRYILLILLLALAVIGLLARRYLPRLFRTHEADGVLLITLDAGAGAPPLDRVLSVLSEGVDNARLQSVSVSGGLTTVHCSFTRLDVRGVEGLEAGLKRIAPIRKINIFYNHRGMAGGSL